VAWTEWLMSPVRFLFFSDDTVTFLLVNVHCAEMFVFFIGDVIVTFVALYTHVLLSDVKVSTVGSRSILSAVP